MQRINSEITGGFGKSSITARPSLSSKWCDSSRFRSDSWSGAKEFAQEDRRFDIRNSSRASVSSMPSITSKAEQPRSRGTKESRGIDKRPRDRRLCRPDAKINISTRCKADTIFSLCTYVNIYWTLGTIGGLQREQCGFCVEDISFTIGGISRCVTDSDCDKNFSFSKIQTKINSWFSGLPKIAFQIEDSADVFMDSRNSTRISESMES